MARSTTIFARWLASLGILVRFMNRSLGVDWMRSAFRGDSYEGTCRVEMLSLNDDPVRFTYLCVKGCERPRVLMSWEDAGAAMEKHWDTQHPGERAGN